MIEITLHDDRTLLVSGASPAVGKQLTLILGRTFDRKAKTWTVPVSAFFAVVNAAGVRNVSIAYDVLVAQETQLKRLVAQYAACGVAIWQVDGIVHTSNELLTPILRPLSRLMADWLPRQMPAVREKKKRAAVEIDQLALIVDGVNNAAKADERKQYMRRRRHAKR